MASRYRDPQSSTMMPMLFGGLGIAAVLLFCLGGAGIAGFVWWRSRPQEEHAKTPPAKDDPTPPEKPQTFKLTEANIKYDWSKSADGIEHMLAFDHGQQVDLHNVNISISWRQSLYKSGASQQLLWQVWRPNEIKRQRFAVREGAQTIRITGQAEGPAKSKYEFDCLIPDPPGGAKIDPIGKIPPGQFQLTNANMKYGWTRTGERFTLTFNHGQPFELKNVQIKIHWIASGFKNTPSSQGLNYAVWGVNEVKTQNMSVTLRPTQIRIVGTAIGPNNAVYSIDCSVPDPQ